MQIQRNRTNQFYCYSDRKKNNRRTPTAEYKRNVDRYDGTSNAMQIFVFDPQQQQ